jgi:RNA polymerase sigma factor (sigma-70 family)
MSGASLRQYRNRILGAAIIARYGNVYAMCSQEDTYGLDPTRVGELLHAKVPPVYKTGEWRKLCLALAEILGILVDDLFPYKIYRKVWPRWVSRQVCYLGQLSPETLAFDLNFDDPLTEATLKERINQVLKTLTDRQQQIIKLRFGLGDGDTYTLEEVGRMCKATKEGVRQIEAKAIRRLQEPKRSNRLKAFVEVSD